MRIQMRNTPEKLRAFLFRSPLMLTFILTLNSVLCLVSQSTHAASQPNKLVMGFVPSRNVSQIQVSADKIADYLETKLGVEVESLVLSNYAGVALAMKSQRVDFAFVGPLNYLKIDDVVAVEPLTASIRNDVKGYRGLIIVRRDSSVNHLADLKNKSIAFGDVMSASGSLYPKYGMQGAGLDIKRDFKSIMLSSNSGIVMSVLKGKVDAGAIYEDARLNPEILKSVPDILDQTKVIHVTQLIPADLQIVRSDLPGAVKSQLRNALLDMSVDVQAKVWLKEIYGIDRLETASAEEYNKLKAVVSKVNPTFLKDDQ